MSTELQIEERKVMTFVPVGKPDPHAYYRAHPEREWRITIPVIDCRLGGYYVVGREVREQLIGEYKRKLFVTCVDRFGNPFLWSLRSKDDHGRLDKCSSSAHAALRLAEKQWIRLRYNEDSGAYDAIEPVTDLGEPTWPGGTFQELIRMAFDGRVIDSMQHPIVSLLRGGAL